jgi:hypothetical protein
MGLSTAEIHPGLLPTPELAIWHAVLKLALLDARKGKECQRRCALAWIESDYFAIGSCAWICEHVGINHRRLASKAGMCFNAPGPSQ